MRLNAFEWSEWSEGLLFGSMCVFSTYLLPLKSALVLKERLILPTELRCIGFLLSPLEVSMQLMVPKSGTAWQNRLWPISCCENDVYGNKMHPRISSLYLSTSLGAGFLRTRCSSAAWHGECLSPWFSQRNCGQKIETTSNHNDQQLLCISNLRFWWQNRVQTIWFWLYFHLQYIYCLVRLEHDFSRYGLVLTNGVTVSDFNEYYGLTTSEARSGPPQPYGCFRK